MVAQISSNARWRPGHTLLPNPNACSGSGFTPFAWFTSASTNRAGSKRSGSGYRAGSCKMALWQGSRQLRRTRKQRWERKEVPDVGYHGRSAGDAVPPVLVVLGHAVREPEGRDRVPAERLPDDTGHEGQRVFVREGGEAVAAQHAVNLGLSARLYVGLAGHREDECEDGGNGL